jgi:hypothetical protein
MLKLTCGKVVISDALVLKLALSQISHQILQSHPKDAHSKVIVILTLVSLHAHLFAIHCSENLDNIRRARHLWYSFSYVIHLTKLDNGNNSKHFL